jgi:hypothetical protein
LGKAFQLGNATLFGLEKPGIQVLVSTLCEHGNKSLVSRW